MIEGHGTGTRLGDRTELQSLAQTYGDTEPGSGALLGSVKSNLGHALAASGALGLAKILVSAEHGAIPPTLHAAEASPEIDWDKQGLRLATELDAVARHRWPAGCGDLGIRDRRHQRSRHRLTSRGRMMLAQPLARRPRAGVAFSA